MLRQLAASRAAHARNWMTRIREGIFHRERLSCRVADSLFDHCADFFVAGFLIDDAVPQQNATCVCVHHKYRMIAGVEQNGVGSFRANAVELQQLCSKLCRRLSKHAGERTGVVAIEERDECLEIPRFLAEVAGRTNQLFEFIDRQFAHSIYVKTVSVTQVKHRFLRSEEHTSELQS